MKKKLYFSKKAWTGLLITAALVCMTATGCRSMIELALMDKASRSEATELRIADLFSADEGFHYPGFSWGSDFAAFQRLTNFSVTDLEGYTETETIYTAGDLHHFMLDKENSTANIGLRKDDEVAFVSLHFEKGEESKELDEFTAKVTETLNTLFGEPDEILTHSEEVNQNLYNIETRIWRYSVGDRITELQWGTATLPGTTVPGFVSLGVDWIRKTEDGGEAE